jgi:arylsulfatase A-like enzyme
MKKIPALFLFSLSLALIGRPTTALAAPGDKPMNFVIFLVDDMGHDDVGYLGGKMQTPNIDQLAHQGMIFSNSYSGGPVCSPTRASLMTGESPARLNFTEIVYPPHLGRPLGQYSPAPPRFKMLNPNTREMLPPDVKTLPEILKDNGYATAIVGKWHLGPFHNAGYPTVSPTNYGFDEAIGWGSAGTSKFPPWYVENLQPDSPHQFITDRLTDEAVKFMTQNKDKPFFLYLAHYSVHSPWAAKPETIPATNPGYAHPVYIGEVTSVDQSLARVRQTLNDLGVADHTAIIFASDNGPVLYAPEKEKTSEIPLGARVTTLQVFRAQKGSLFDGGIRVPTVIYVPGMTAPGSVNRTPMATYDFLPTIVDLAGKSLPPGLHLDGQSLVPELQGKEDYERAVYFHRPDYLQYWVHAENRLALSENPRSAIRQGKFKFILPLDGSPEELYDLETDPGERTNIASSFPADAARLKSELQAWLKDTNAQMPIPNPAYNGKGVDLPLPPTEILPGKLTAAFDEID